MQQVQVQLAGSKQQLNLVQERLSSGGATQPQPPYPSGISTNSHVQPAATDQDYGQDHEYQNAQVYPGNQDADMDFEPPGSSGGLDRDASFDPSGLARPGSDARQEMEGSEGQEQGQGDLYSPGLSAQPSGMYISDPNVHGKFLVEVYMPDTRGHPQPTCVLANSNCTELASCTGWEYLCLPGRLCLSRSGWLIEEHCMVPATPPIQAVKKLFTFSIACVTGPAFQMCV